MIKIIENGSTHQRKRCEKCGCVFEFGIEDANYYSGKKRFINCPECRAVIEVVPDSKGFVAPFKRLENLKLILKRKSDSEDILAEDTLAWKALIDGRLYGEYFNIRDKDEEALMGCVNFVLLHQL